MNLVVEAVAAKMGGNVTYVRELCRHLPRHVGPLTLISPAGAVAADSAPGLHHRATKPGYGAGPQLAAARQIHQALSRGSRPVLYATANFSSYPPHIPQLLQVMNALFFDRGVEDRLQQPLSVRQRLKQELRRGLCIASCRVARHIFTPSESLKHELLAACPALAGKVESIPLGVDTARFSMGRTQRIHSPKGRLKVVCHSLVYNHKPAWPLVEGVAKAREAGADITLTLVDDPRTLQVLDAAEAVAADRAVVEKAVQAGWLSFTGRQPFDTLGPLLAAHDAFAFHTLCESFGFPFVEAMASGLPSVLADIPVAREMAGDSALYYRVFDTDALAAHLVQLANEPNLRRELAERAWQTHNVGRYSWDQHFRRVAHILDDLAHDRPVRPADGASI